MAQEACICREFGALRDFSAKCCKLNCKMKTNSEVHGGRRLLYSSIDSGSAGTGENGRPVLWLANTFNDSVLQQHIVACQRIKSLYCFLFHMYCTKYCYRFALVLRLN
jgi:hypothetical protein